MTLFLLGAAFGVLLGFFLAIALGVHLDRRRTHGTVIDFTRRRL